MVVASWRVYGPQKFAPKNLISITTKTLFQQLVNPSLPEKNGHYNDVRACMYAVYTLYVPTEKLLSYITTRSSTVHNSAV